MNEVSIIINGVRYDAVEVGTGIGCSDNCDLARQCLYSTCGELLESTQVFKKSDKIESTEWIKIERDKDGFAIDKCLDKICQLFSEDTPIAIAYNNYGINYDIIATSSDIQGWLADIHNSSKYTHYLPIKRLRNDRQENKQENRRCCIRNKDSIIQCHSKDNG